MHASVEVYQDAVPPAAILSFLPDATSRVIFKCLKFNFFNSIWAVPTLLIDFFFLSLSHHSSVANVCMFSFEIFACEISTRRVVECGEFYRWARRWRPTRRASSWGWATASWPCRHLLRLRADPARATWSEPGGRPLPISPPNCCRILLCTALGKLLPILHTNFGNNNQ